MRLYALGMGICCASHPLDFLASGRPFLLVMVSEFVVGGHRLVGWRLLIFLSIMVESGLFGAGGDCGLLRSVKGVVLLGFMGDVVGCIDIVRDSIFLCIQAGS